MRKVICVLLVIISIFSFAACSRKSESLNAVKDFSVVDTLEQVNDEQLDVVLLFGQSNATGVASVEYLKNDYPSNYELARLYVDKVMINYFVDNGANTSEGKFVSTALGQGANQFYFGPEVGMAYWLQNSPRKTCILKYTWGGTILDSQWLDSNYKRGELYNAAMNFVSASMDYLISKGYKASIVAICWMQGESDAYSDETTKRYYKNTDKFVSYLRKDLENYSEEDFMFIDAGISDSIIWKNYKEVNKAKEDYASTHKNCYYFSTIDLGLTVDKEPVDSPDIAHYDSDSMFTLGQKFARYVYQPMVI